MALLLDDVRAAIRGFVRRPLLALVAVLMLALGLGFNTALFAVVDAVLLRPLPYPDADRLVMLWTGRNPDGTGAVNSFADFLEWQSSAQSFEALAAYNISFAPLTGAGDPEEVNGSVVTADFFKVIGANALHGRTIAPGDELVDVSAGRPIVISHSLWVRRFSGDPAVVGRTLTLAGRTRRIVGVMPAAFEHPEPFWGATAEYWSPMTITDEMRTAHGFRYLRVIARLRRGVTHEAAGREMDSIGRRLMDQMPTTHASSVVVHRLVDDLTGNTRPLAVAFLAATIFVLSLVVANVVNLLIARVSHRRGEFAIRVALGASRARLVSQVLAESVVIGLAGGLAGLACAAAGLQLVRAYGPGDLAGLESAGLDVRSVGFSIVLAVATGLVCGAWPATRLARARLAGLLQTTRETTGLEVSRRRSLIIATEVALAVPLLFGAGLLARTLVTLQQTDPGFDPAGAMQFRVSLTGPRYSSADARIVFFDELVERLSAIPGVLVAGATSSLPLGGLNNTGASVVYERPDGSFAEAGIGSRVATSGYFRALGIQTRAGRIFDDSTGDALTVVVNDRAAETFWPGQNPIGRRVRFGTLADAPDASTWLTVVGVVGSVRHEALGRPPNAEIFAPYRSNAWGTLTLVARTSGDPSSLSTPLRQAVAALDPLLPIVNLAPVDGFLEGQLRQPRFGALCAIVFGALGLVLAAAGTFGVLWLFVTQRTREIGVRMAFGASPGRVGRLIVSQSLKPAAVGSVAGAVLAIWAGRAIESVLVEVSASDPVAILSSVVTVLSVAALASWLPAHRAMRTDPIVTLRAE